MAKSHPESTEELYVKLIIALADFTALLFFIYLHIQPNSVTVPTEIFMLLIGILGAMLGQDILRDVRSGKGR